MIPTISFAHTTITNSTPSEGAVVTSDLSELSVEFAEEIENQSTLLLTNENGEDIPLDSITVNDNIVTGNLSTPLENGNYTITWKIAAKDGHAISGEIPFTVEAITKEDSVEEIPKQTENVQTEQENKDDSSTNTESSSTEELSEDSELTEANESENVQENKASLLPTISVIVLVVLLGAGILMLMRKKR
ncbi:methionine-rich copper-binding protein CopC [Metabacillus crassostreae]|uniref:copper resistance CopC family protein n=1 Tax=Metabacillus crassostreae TaxID=929098 RepID=UPI001957B6E0|nr:copper resistance protein CopC [Metabacillus crassostreae]MBM7603669.1 methionine-rich copper-binding protein CopC [Metabacillus crassostreae]